MCSRDLYYPVRVFAHWESGECPGIVAPHLLHLTDISHSGSDI